MITCTHGWLTLSKSVRYTMCMRPVFNARVCILAFVYLAFFSSHVRGALALNTNVSPNSPHFARDATIYSRDSIVIGAQTQRPDRTHKTTACAHTFAVRRSRSLPPTRRARFSSRIRLGKVVFVCVCALGCSNICVSRPPHLCAVVYASSFVVVIIVVETRRQLPTVCSVPCIVCVTTKCSRSCSIDGKCKRLCLPLCVVKLLVCVWIYHIEIVFWILHKTHVRECLSPNTTVFQCSVGLWPKTHTQ